MILSQRLFCSSLLAAALTALALPAQAGLSAATSPAAVDLQVVTVDGRPAVQGEYIVHFAKRPFDLSTLRAAAKARVAAPVYAQIVDSIRERNEALRAPFGAAIAALGGKILEHYWIINASAILIDPALVEAVGELPGVDRVQPNWVFEPSLGTVTNAANHDSDGANLLMVSGKKIRGEGVTVAILDTGVDVNTANLGRPHRLYYEGGTTNGRNRILAALDAVRSGSGDDINGHGTMVSHCAGGAAWSSSSYVDDGIAPSCDFLGINIAASSTGSTASTYLTRGWQWVLQYLRTYNISVANNSYSGSPDPRDATQQALDSAALNGDVLITVPSGNTGTNILYTQAGFNGLNVGSANKNSHSLSSFSGRGTTQLGKEIPDLVAIGASVYVALRDRESSVTQASGTSFSAPIVAGSAALARQADPKLTALMTKALLLNFTKANSNGYGMGAGFMRADRIAQAALNQEVFEDKVSSSTPKKILPFVVKNTGSHAVTITWNRTQFGAANNDDLSLRVLDASNNVVGSSTRGYANSYERVEFSVLTPGAYRAEVTVSSLVNPSVDFAIAGAGQPVPPSPPTLTQISASKYPVYGGGDLTLTGTNLETVTTVHVGTQQVSPKSVTPTQLVFTPPLPTALGQVQVKVQNGGGTSGAVSFDYIPVLQPALAVTTSIFTLVPLHDDLWMDPQQVGIYFLSTSNAPSRAPGIVDLGIGNAFTDLHQWGVFVPDTIGRGTLQWAIPPGFASLTFYVQAVVLDIPSSTFPLQTSQAVPRTVLF